MWELLLFDARLQRPLFPARTELGRRTNTCGRVGEAGRSSASDDRTQPWPRNAALANAAATRMTARHSVLVVTPAVSCVWFLPICSLIGVPQAERLPSGLV